MKAEFFRDENNNVWFSNAKDIQIRRCKPKVAMAEFASEKIEETMRKIRDRNSSFLNREIQEFETK